MRQADLCTDLHVAVVKLGVRNVVLDIFCPVDQV
jgi:hypothetical protein